ncbi:glycosyltransferase [Candidatus Uhrbacteria bacterium]|nr:glycosyltransferase [Candidatus Uhrbacteria bacterium]
MNILITYGRKKPHPPFGTHLVRAFRTLGHHAVLLPVRDRPLWGTCVKRLPKPWKSHWEWKPKEFAIHKVFKAMDQARYDLLIELGGNLFTDSALHTIKKRSRMQVAAWLTEGPLKKELHIGLSAYDRIVSTSMVAVRQLHEMGFPEAAYLPFATDPDYFHPRSDSTTQAPLPLGQIGTFSEKRVRYLEPVSDLGLVIWGPNWDTMCSSLPLRRALIGRRGVYGRKLVDCYQMTKILINIQREHLMVPTPSGQRESTELQWRHFDIPACGNLLLTEWVMELPDAFQVGKETDAFSSPEELRDKARYYLTHENQRKAMVKRGRERVLRDHTYIQRAQNWIDWFDHTQRKSF